MSGYWLAIAGLLAIGCIALGVLLGEMWASGRRERRDYEGAHRVRRNQDRTGLVSQEHRPGPPWGSSSWE